MARQTDLNHCLQLRLSKDMVDHIDGAISTFPLLFGFSRCRFIREAVSHALDSLAEEGRKSG
jgi:hypothetical protein